MPPDSGTANHGPGLLWYAGYGSNLDPGRFSYYIAGGRPPGSRRVTPGARDATPPRQTRSVVLPGRMIFGWESPSWGGGVSFLDVTGDVTGPLPGDVTGAGVLATAYLVTEQQFADVAAQEMHREPGDDIDLSEVLANRAHSYGPGRYETLHLVGELDGVPMLTFTTDDPEHLPRNAPSGAYLAATVRGLKTVHALDDAVIVDYLLGCEGMETWAPDEVRRLVAATR